MVVNKKQTENQGKITGLLEDLALLEGYVKELFSFSPLPICFLNPIGVILEANPALEEISGYDLYELIGEPIEKLFDQGEIEELLRETREKGLVKAKEITLFSKEKKEVLVSAFSQVRKSDGEIIGYLLGLFDLSEIKKTESALRETQTALLNMLEDIEEARQKAEEERNKTLAIITNLSEGLLVFNGQDRLYLINPQAENFFDLKARDIIGRSISELTTFSPLESLMKLIREEMKEVFRKELSVKENLILEVSTVPMMKEREKLGTLVILHDVTREKMIERMKSEFVSLAAHQLRTPLSAIKWTLRMLLDGDLGQITKEQRDFIEKTYQSNERMIALINDLLNVTRIEEGRYLYKPSLVDIEPVFLSVIDSYKEQIEKKGLRIEFQRPKGKLPRVLVDVEKITLAFQNLLDNAIRYTLIGGQVTISLKSDKEKLVVTVKDNGIGIPKDQQERVFAKFFRGSNVIKMETEGTGLGLFIARNIIEAHGGRIWFESEEGKGSTFYFSLPVEKGT